MNRNTYLQIALVTLLFGFAGWYLHHKGYLRISLGRKAVQQEQAQAQQPKETAVPLKVPFPVPDPPKMADDDIYPLSQHAKLLEGTPSPPTKRAPILYMAPLFGDNDKETTAANSFDSLLRFQVRASLPREMGINIIPFAFLESPFAREDGNWSARGHSADTYLRDARQLDADIFIYGRLTRSTGQLTVLLASMDLRTSRTDTFSLTKPETSFHEILAETARACGRFCGLSSADIQAHGMDKGTPNAAFYQALISEEDGGDSLLRELLKQNPECPVVYDVAYENIRDIQIINAGLKKWPDDPRLLRTKSRRLRWNKPYIALLMHSELLRRYPDNFMFLNDLAPVLERTYVSPGVAADAPPVYSAAEKLMASMIERHPNNWCMRWDYSNLAATFASYIRGHQTVNKIPVHIWPEYERLTEIANREIDKAVEIQPGCPRMLGICLRMHFLNGDSHIEWQREMINKIHAVDPSNVQAELTAAYSHSVGWDDDEHFIGILQDAARDHANDPRAQGMISDELNTDFARRVSFGQTTWEDIWAKSDPRTDLFIQTTEAAMAGGVQMSNPTAGILRTMYFKRFGHQKAYELIESGKHWALTAGASNEAHDRGDFEKSLVLARKALPITKNVATRERLQYNMAKSLWKLKRLDESLAESVNGMTEFPDKQTFYYMYAIVALEKGEKLDDAYRFAYKAVDISTTNTGANETFEKLRAKLNKPKHPKLKGS